MPGANYGKFSRVTNKTQVAITQSGAIDVGQTDTCDKAMVAATVFKTGAGKGAIKLQGSVDGTNWTDLPGTPAASTVAAGSANGTVYCTTNPFPLARVLLTEDGTGTATVTQVDWSAK